MITKWKLCNFKSVRDDTELAIGPLTIFAGANSSGKSSIIQSMLLVSQTLASKVGSRPVVLNGHLCRLGQFDDLRSYQSGNSHIHIGWECQPKSPGSQLAFESSVPDHASGILYPRRTSQIKGVSCGFSFDVDPTSPQRDLMQLQPRLLACSVTCDTSAEDGTAMTSRLNLKLIEGGASAQEARIRRLAIPSPESETGRSTLSYETELDDDSKREIREELASAEPVGCGLQHFLPHVLSVRYDEVDEEARMWETVLCTEGLRVPRNAALYRYEGAPAMPPKVVELLRSRLPAHWTHLVDPPPGAGIHTAGQSSPTLTMRHWIERLRAIPLSQRRLLAQPLQDLAPDVHKAVTAGRSHQYALAPFRLPRAVRDAVSYLDAYFSNSIKYLGPLRDEPKALYPLAAPIDPADLGLRGEYTAAVLDLHRTRRITYIPAENFASATIGEGTSTTTLQLAVHDWLKYLGVAASVATKDRGKLGHELKVTPAGLAMSQDLTHVGVGVSQVLPILVTCLLADADTTLIFEQPELHLHPRVQTLLADFFLSMSLLGKQCIIETHSEYLINRLRSRVASSLMNTLSQLIKTYFVEIDAGVSSFREVIINDYGAILDWPDGFFDQSQRESEEILRAAMIKKQRERERSDA